MNQVPKITTCDVLDRGVNIMNRTISCLLIVVCFASVASAAVLWDDGGGDSDWHTPENWDGDVLPGVDDQWIVHSGYTANINADVDGFRFNIAWWGGGDGHVIINNANVIASGGAGIGQGDNAYIGQLTMNGGTLTLGSWGFFVGYQDGTGILNMNDGLIDASAVTMRVGYGTWGADEVTEGYVYLHGGTIQAGDITLYDIGPATGTQVGEMEICGDGKLILNGDKVDPINDEIDVWGTIYGCSGQQVVASYDADTNKTTVQVYDPNVVNLLGTYVDAIPGDLPNGNTVRASDGSTGSWYDGPTTEWSTPHAPKWFAYSGDGGLNSDAQVGTQLDYYSLNYYGEGGDPLPTLRSTITGLQDNGLYDVYVVYKSALVTDPEAPPVPASEGVKAALTGEPMVTYTNVEGTFVGPEVPMGTGYSFFQALLGNTRAYGGEISVDIDVIGTATGEETLYDGLAYRLTEVLPSCEEIVAQYGYEADVSGPAGQPDCKINLFDFAALASQWMRCIEPTDVNCEHPWE